MLTKPALGLMALTGVRDNGQGSPLPQLGGEDGQSLLSRGHHRQCLHLPATPRGLLEMDLQDVVQLLAVQYVGNVEHQH